MQKIKKLKKIPFKKKLKSAIFVVQKNKLIKKINEENVVVEFGRF